MIIFGWFVQENALSFMVVQVDPSKSEASLPETTIPKKLTLTQAVMCESIKELVPQNPAIVFSISTGKVFCFTSFNPVPERTYIYHSWYRMDKLSTKIKLTLNIPAWSTYSSIQLREADIGPWRVEISDDKGNIFEVLRFSITE